MSNPRLPDYITIIADGGNKVKASVINGVTPSRDEVTQTFAGDGSQVRLIYGRAQVGGLIVALGQIGTDEVYCVVWCGGGETKGVKAVYINNAAVDAGITVTHYKGAAGQTADATLASAISGYTDTLDDISYSVFRIPDGTLTGWPRFLADFEGLLCYDPRDLTTAYTENPALMVRDLITNTDYGLGGAITGIDESADHCDFLLGGTEIRCVTNYIIERPTLTLGHSRVLAEYADCFLIDDGDGYRLRPDVASDSVATYTDQDFVDGLAIDVGNLSSAPTSVDVRYVEQVDSAETWPELTANNELPGLALGTLPFIPSSVRLNGVSRFSEANRKSISRLYRGLLISTFSFTSRDFMVLQQIGDVITLDSTLANIAVDVRVIGIKLIDLGLYRVTCGEYSTSAYQDDAGTALPTTDVPVGAIVMKLSGTTPSGWSDFTAADGTYIMGAGSTHAVNATGGSNSVTISGATSLSKDHNGDGFLTNEGTGTGTTYAKTGGDDVSGHDHAYSKAKTLNPKTRAVTLIKKTTATATHLPSNVALMFDGAGYVIGLQQQTDGAGRLVKADTDRADSGGIDTETITTSTVTTDQHGTTGSTRIAGSSAENYKLIAAGSHDHTLTVEIVSTVKTKHLELWASAVDYKIVEGGIVFWDTATPPVGWVVCDGTNGTPDMRDYILSISNSVNSGSSSGNNKATWTSVISPAGSHKHKGEVQADGQSYDSITATHDDYQGAHAHTADGNVNFTPSFTALNIIKYVGI